MDYGNGKRRKGFWINNKILKENERKALIGFHSFTGNDFVPDFFGKGKKCCWSILRKDEKFVVAFNELGRNWKLTGKIVTALEKYICTLYGSKENSVDAARLDMLMKKQTKENKVIDLSVMPPCFFFTLSSNEESKLCRSCVKKDNIRKYFSRVSKNMVGKQIVQ